MTLVNDTDAKRENIDEYLKELETMSDEQLSLLSSLREVRACDHYITRVFQNEKPNLRFTPCHSHLLVIMHQKRQMTTEALPRMIIPLTLMMTRLILEINVLLSMVIVILLPNDTYV